jgi:BirA family biotin operon repressor/biotin-[acetyl-CoA-carboxylase] ligase
MNLEKIKNANTKYLGKEIIYKEEMESTQDLAKELVKKDICKNGTIVITDNQTKGRGTKGRSWIASKDKNITMTIILNENLEITKLEGITLRIAESIRDAIKELYNYTLTIKVPNDLLLNEKKICGILTETSITSNKVNYVLIGIGFDVNEESFNEELRKHCNIFKKRVWKGF